MFDIITKGDFNLLKWLGFKGKPSAVRKPDGYTKTTGPYGEIVDCDTLRCCHCGGHWEVIVGSGRFRGECRRCMGYTCGQPACMICHTWQQKLENLENGRPRLELPTGVVFGELGPKAGPCLE